MLFRSIRSLPKELIEAFRATLEELESADLLLHVADASHPELELQLKAVKAIVASLDLAETPVLLVLNKIDAIGEERLLELQESYPEAIGISARERVGLEELAQAIIDRIDWTSEGQYSVALQKSQWIGEGAEAPSQYEEEERDGGTILI